MARGASHPAKPGALDAPDGLWLMPGERLVWLGQAQLVPLTRLGLAGAVAAMLGGAAVAGLGLWLLAGAGQWVMAFLATGGDITPFGGTGGGEDQDGPLGIFIFGLYLTLIAVNALVAMLRKRRDRRGARPFVTDRRVGVLLPGGRLSCIANRPGLDMALKPVRGGDEICFLPVLRTDLPPEAATKAQVRGTLRLRDIGSQMPALQAALSRHPAATVADLPAGEKGEWRPFLPPGEHLVWTGRPRGGFLLTRGGKLAWVALAGLALLLGALLLRLVSGQFVDADALASQVFIGLALVVCLLGWQAFALIGRRRTRYALTDRTAVIRLRGGMGSPRYFPLSADMMIDLTPGPAGSVIFATESRKKDDGWEHERVGFRGMADAEEPWRILLALRGALTRTAQPERRAGVGLAPGLDGAAQAGSACELRQRPVFHRGGGMSADDGRH